MDLCYFDHNSTTPLSDAGREAWLEASDDHWLNPSSPYRKAAAVKVRLEAARESLADCFDVSKERIVFTSGATEANNSVIRSWEHAGMKGKVGINPTEHPSVLEAANYLLGDRVQWLPLQSDGRVDLEAFEASVRSGEISAVSVMAANNETGVIQPWEAIAELCHEIDIPYHCDASQWVGRMSVRGLNACSYVTACAHKFGGPKGVGFMLVPEIDAAFSILRGGAQELDYRAGTEDVPGVLSMVAALQASALGSSDLRDVFVDRIRSEIEGVEIVGEAAPRLWNTIALLMPRHPSVRWVRALEKAGFLVGAGAACSTGKSTASSVLRAMGVEAEIAGRLVRVSSGATTSASDWANLADAFIQVYQQLESFNDSPGKVISID